MSTPAPPVRPAAGRSAGQLLSSVWVLTVRNLLHIAREPMRLSDATIQPVVFTLLFVYVFGAGVVLADGASYEDFAVAGLLALNLTTGTVGTAVGLSEDLGTGVIDRFRALPLWRPAIIVARSLADLLTAVICAFFVVLTGLLVGWRPDADVGSVVAAFAIFLLFSYAISWVSACIGVLSRDPESSQGIGLIVLFPLAIVSNAMVPTENMPALLRTLADWNPVSAVTAAARDLLGNPNPSAAVDAWPMQHPVLASLLWSVALIGVFAPVATAIYRRRTTD